MRKGGENRRREGGEKGKKIGQAGGGGGGGLDEGICNELNAIHSHNLSPREEAILSLLLWSCNETRYSSRPPGLFW